MWIGWGCKKNGGVSKKGVVKRSGAQLAKDGHANLPAEVRQLELHAVVASEQRTNGHDEAHAHVAKSWISV